MYLLPGNPFSQAVEAYRDSGEALCSKGMQAVTPPFTRWPEAKVSLSVYTSYPGLSSIDYRRARRILNIPVIFRYNYGITEPMVRVMIHATPRAQEPRPVWVSVTLKRYG